ncbi:MAG: hypothetical protein ACLFQB_15510 [Chitinispirillaceae bacterium]
MFDYSRIAASVAAREELTKAFDQADITLKEKIDKLMKMQKKHNPDFFSRYDQARVIKDLGIRYEATEDKEMQTA